jgi:hypothetical protein
MKGHLMGTGGKMMASVHKEYSISQFKFKREAKARMCTLLHTFV